MKKLIFKLIDNENSHAIVSTDSLHLLKDSEFKLLKASKDQEVLTRVQQIKKDQIAKLITNKKEKDITIISQNKSAQKLNFVSISIFNQFIATFPTFKIDKDTSIRRVNPIIALIMMLFSYSFIWAGTRLTEADIDPEGIRLNLVALTVKFLKWLNSIVGQQLLLIIGITMLAALFALIFRPELIKLFGNKIYTYHNTLNERDTDAR